MTDEEQVNWCREQLQSIVNEADFSGGPQEALDSTGLKQEGVQVYGFELRELGRFDIEIPPAMRARMDPLEADSIRRHWVYQHNNTGVVYVLGLPARLMLRRMGYARLHAFIQENN